jgi:hypothetical protein
VVQTVEQGLKESAHWLTNEQDNTNNADGYTCNIPKPTPDVGLLQQDLLDAFPQHPLQVGPNDPGNRTIQRTSSLKSFNVHSMFGQLN